FISNHHRRRSHSFMGQLGIVRTNFAIEEPSLPDFKVDQRPQSFRVVFTRVVPRNQFANKAGFEYAALERAWTQHVLIDYVTKLVSKPRSHRHRETHLSPRQNFFWQPI